MNKKELILRVSKSTKMTQKEVNLVLTEVIETIMESVSKGKNVRLVGFGSFSLKTSIKNNHLLRIKDSTKKVSNQVVKFSAGKFFKENIAIFN
jgi:DNA-binding protein HU-beta